MKVFVYRLIQPALLLLFCGPCLAAVRMKVDADNQPSIYRMTPRFKAMRSDLKVSKERSTDHIMTTNFSRADFPCPESAAITPCTCTVSSNSRVDIDCTFVESLDQLVEVFQQDFPAKELYRFTMANNSAINWFPSFMNGITFEIVSLSPGPFNLTLVTEHFLYDLKDSLRYFTVYRSKLSTDLFPFFMLPSMNQLEDLRIYFTDINWIPQIEAPKLARFALEHSPYDLLVNGTFPIGTGPMSILLFDNQIHTIEVGSFFFADQNSAASAERIEIVLQNNQVQFLKASTFPLRNGPMYVYLNFNQISSIEPGTFVLPASTDLLTLYLRLDNNVLTTVNEMVFRSMMPYISDLYLSDNPLSCDCDMAWLIVNEGFMAKVDVGATCDDGTNLHDLDPQQFIDFC